MKKISAQLIVFASFLAASASPAFAAMIDATDPADIYEMAKGFGSAELGKDGRGDPFITGRIDGTKYGIIFYGCTDGKDCDDIQFAAAWSDADVSLDEINRWNLETRYGKAYLDRDGDPTLDMIVNIDYGVSRENLEDSFSWWQRAIKGFREEILKQ